jgi:outer membrane receptor protein involved in Fe transport
LRDNITVDIAGVAVVDIALQVGATTETVTVSGTAEQLQSTTSDLGHVVDDTMMTSLPLSSRNFTQVLALSPGVTANVIDAGALGRNSVNISANGARPWDNNVVLNGMNADNPMSQGFDDAPDKTGIAVPAPDAIDEFKVQTGLYDAEFGKEGGGTVNIVTKSGTNQFHGTAFEFFRNTAMDANNFFQNASGAPRPVFRQNQYGGTVGGPVKKDKVFFFVSYQGTNQANGVSSSSNKTTFLPVLGNRTAQALGAVYGGQTGAFSGVPIAANGSNINPVALALLNAKLPSGQYAIPSACILTNSTTGYCALSAPALFNEKQIIANGDLSLTSKQRLSLKTLYSRDPTSLPFEGSTNVLGFGENDYHANTNLSLSHTYSITPTLINEIRAGYAKNLDQQLPVTPITSAQLGMAPAVLPDMPSILLTGGFDIGAGRNENQIIRQTEVEFDDTISKVLGRHSLSFGGNYNPVRVLYSDLFVQRGELQIQSFPDFLLGMTSAQNGTPYSNLAQTLVGNGRPAVYPNTNNFAFFAQDDFRVSDRLTLNLGVRYQFNGQASYGDGKMSNWDYRLYPKGVPPAGGTLAGLVLLANVPSDIPIPDGVTKLNHDTLIDNQNWLGFSPRVGLAYRPIRSLQNLVVRVGYGLFWSAVAGTYSIGTSAGEPFYASVLAGGASNPNVSLQNPYPSVPPISAFPVYQPIVLGSNPTVYPYDPLMRQPHTQTYSGNIQYEIKKVLMTIGYVGSQTKNIVGFVAPNQAGLATPQNPINGQTTSTLANLLLRVPEVGFAPGIDSIGEFMNTYCTSEQACSANPYSGQPYWSRYNSLQLSASKRYSNGLSFSGAYTWSNAIDNINGSTTGRQQSLGTAVGNYWAPLVGPSNFIRQNIFTASYLYEIPKAPVTGALKAIVNGWSVSGVVIIETGLPFSISDSRGGTVYGVGGSGSSSYAEFAAGMGPGNVGISNPTLSHYFNTSVFVPPPAIGDGIGFGNSPKNFMTGPGSWNTDFALVKAFTIREPLHLEFRAELFNLFNHPNFGNPGANVASSGSFGVISSTVSSPRIAQFALKLRF